LQRLLGSLLEMARGSYHRKGRYSSLKPVGTEQQGFEGECERGEWDRYAFDEAAQRWSLAAGASETLPSGNALRLAPKRKIAPLTPVGYSDLLGRRDWTKSNQYFWRVRMHKDVNVTSWFKL
jgi:hypothetical protein